MNVKLKHPISQPGIITNEVLQELAREFREEIKPCFPLDPTIRFSHFFVLPDYYRELRDHIKSGGAIQRSDNGGWRKV